MEGFENRNFKNSLFIGGFIGILLMIYSGSYLVLLAIIGTVLLIFYWTLNTVHTKHKENARILLTSKHSELSRLTDNGLLESSSELMATQMHVANKRNEAIKMMAELEAARTRSSIESKLKIQTQRNKSKISTVRESEEEKRIRLERTLQDQLEVEKLKVAAALEEANHTRILEEQKLKIFESQELAKQQKILEQAKAAAESKLRAVNRKSN